MQTLPNPNWIQTFSGKMFFPASPAPESICIEDIAHALSLQCRYTGHVRDFYSVAQHSYLVSLYVPPEYALDGLMHDATEAYLADIARPVKRQLPEYAAMEDRIYEAIAARFGLRNPIPDIVKEIDFRMLENERDTLMGEPPAPWSLHPKGRLQMRTILPVPPRSAEAMFLTRYERLMRGTRS